MREHERVDERGAALAVALNRRVAHDVVRRVAARRAHHLALAEPRAQLAMASFLNSVRGSVTNAVGSVGKAVGVTGPAPGAPKVDTAEREARLQASAAAADESPFAQGMQEAKK